MACPTGAEAGGSDIPGTRSDWLCQFALSGALTMASSPDSGLEAMVCFRDRQAAGEQLAAAVVRAIAANPPPGVVTKRGTDGALAQSPYIVYALPRGGLPVAVPIAQRLRCPLDVVVAKKITRLDNPELAIGAVTADGQTLWLTPERSPLAAFGHLQSRLSQARAQAQTKAQQQLAEFRQVWPAQSPTGAIAIVVDDGIATGMTMAAAVQALRAQAPAEVWICAPVAPPDLVPQLQAWGDRVILLATPSPFNSVSRFYQAFPQVEMAAALAALQTANAPAPEATGQEAEPPEPSQNG